MSIVAPLDIPEQYESYQAYYDAILDILHSGGKVMLILIGVSSSGKTSLVTRLQTFFTETSFLRKQVLSLDEIREEINGGRYPTANEYTQIHQQSLPIYQKRLSAADAPLLLIDNTNLRYAPDVQNLLLKACRDKYHVITMSPPWHIGAITTYKQDNKHNVTAQTYYSMLCRWPRLVMDRFIYKMIHPEHLQDVMMQMEISQHDIHVPKNMFLVPWGTKGGYLYTLKNYIGYIDPTIGQAIMSAGHIMQELGEGDMFLRKSPPVHLTLFRKTKDACFPKLMKSILAKVTEPPLLTFSGLHMSSMTSKKNNQLWFITVTPETQKQWKEMFVNLGIEFDQQLHVTVGYTDTDLHDIDKSIDPMYKFGDVASPCHETKELVSPYRGKYTPQLNAQLHESQAVHSVHSGLTLHPDYLYASAQLLDNYAWLHRNIRVQSKHRSYRFCGTNNTENITLVSFQVKGNKGRSDDEIYKMYPRLNTLVPRGLCYVLLDKQLIGLVYPTSKFFGDNDTRDEVEVMDTKTIHDLTTFYQHQAENQSSSPCSEQTIFKCLVTEKANGEMFTVSCLKLPKTNTGYLFVLGSKNNKYAFYLSDTVIDNLRIQEIDEMIKQYLKDDEITYFENYLKGRSEYSASWFMTRVWLEMTRCFFRQFIALPAVARKEWCIRLSSEHLTACGEFESGHHPHLLPFAVDHEDIKFFALTSYDEQGGPKPREVDAYLNDLQWINKIGFHVVGFHIHTLDGDIGTAMMDLRHQIWFEQEQEGKVVIPIVNNTMQNMIKLKTIWYVCYRGVRERLKRFREKWHIPENEQKIKQQLQQVMDSKMLFFTFKDEEQKIATRDLWRLRAVQCAEKLISMARSDPANARQTFDWNFPSLLSCSLNGDTLQFNFTIDEDQS